MRRARAGGLARRAPSVADAVEVLVERDELAVRVVELAALDGALDGVKFLEGGGEFVAARAFLPPRFEGAGRGASGADERRQGRRALPLLQVDFDLGDAVSGLLDLGVARGQFRLLDKKRSRRGRRGARAR